MDEQEQLWTRQPWLATVEAEFLAIWRKIPRREDQLKASFHFIDLMRRLSIVAMRVEHPDWTVDQILREMLSWDGVQIPADVRLGAAYEGMLPRPKSRS